MLSEIKTEEINDRELIMIKKKEEEIKSNEREKRSKFWYLSPGP